MSKIKAPKKGENSKKAKKGGKKVFNPFYEYNTASREKFFNDKMRCLMFLLSETYLRDKFDKKSDEEYTEIIDQFSNYAKMRVENSRVSDLLNK